MSGEEWRRVGRHDRYEVSSLGRVRNRETGHVLALLTHNKGYRKVKLGRGIYVYVHQLVAEAWLGEIPFGQQVDHVDFDRANNRPSNLRYLPAPDNRTRWQKYVLGEPEDHVPLSDDEVDALADELEAVSGW